MKKTIKAIEDALNAALDLGYKNYVVGKEKAKEAVAKARHKASLAARAAADLLAQEPPADQPKSAQAKKKSSSK